MVASERNICAVVLRCSCIIAVALTPLYHASCDEHRNRLEPNDGEVVSTASAEKETSRRVELIIVDSDAAESDLMQVSPATATWFAKRIVDIPAGNRTAMEFFKVVLYATQHGWMMGPGMFTNTKRIRLPRIRGPALYVLLHGCHIYDVRMTQDPPDGVPRELHIRSASVAKRHSPTPD